MLTAVGQELKRTQSHLHFHTAVLMLTEVVPVAPRGTELAKHGQSVVGELPLSIVSAARLYNNGTYPAGRAGDAAGGGALSGAAEDGCGRGEPQPVPLQDLSPSKWSWAMKAVQSFAISSSCRPM